MARQNPQGQADMRSEPGTSTETTDGAQTIAPSGYSLMILIQKDRRHENATALEPADIYTFYPELIFRGVAPPEMPTLRFAMPKWCLRRDYIDICNVALAYLISQRFLDMLHSERVPCRTYPVEMVDEKTKQLFEARYHLFIPDKIEDAVDIERSEFHVFPEPIGRELTNLALKPEVAAGGHLLFTAGPTVKIVAHDKLRARIEAAKLVGIGFAPLDTVFHPWLGLDTVKLRKQLRDTPTDVEKWGELARLFMTMYRPREALEAVDHALELRPDLAEAWLLQGMALAAYERAMALNEQSPPGAERPLGPQDWAWQDRSELLRKLGRYAEALPLAERGVRIFPHAVIAWHELGMVRLGLGDVGAALDAFEQAPVRGAGMHDERLYEAKGETFLRLGRDADALTMYEHALQFTPDNFSLVRGRIEALRGLGRDAEAEAAEAEFQETMATYESLRATRPW